jgi:hypothetical protein
VLGGEFSGEVVELGENVKNLSVGDQVMCRGGSGWAEYAIADYRRTLKIGTGIYCGDKLRVCKVRFKQCMMLSYPMEDLKKDRVCSYKAQAVTLD